MRTYSLSIERHPDGYLANFPAHEGCKSSVRMWTDANRPSPATIRIRRKKARRTASKLKKGD